MESDSSEPDRSKTFDTNLCSLYSSFIERGKYVIRSYQRFASWSFSSGISFIESIMRRSVLGIIVLNEFAPDPEKPKSYRYSVIDGQQRMRTIEIFMTGVDSKGIHKEPLYWKHIVDGHEIREIYNSKVPLPKGYRYMSEDDRDLFDRTTIAICQYNNIPIEKEKKLFSDINHSTAIKIDSATYLFSMANGNPIIEGLFKFGLCTSFDHWNYTTKKVVGLRSKMKDKEDASVARDYIKFFIFLAVFHTAKFRQNKNFLGFELATIGELKNYFSNLVDLKMTKRIFDVDVIDADFERVKLFLVKFDALAATSHFSTHVFCGLFLFWLQNGDGPSGDRTAKKFLELESQNSTGDRTAKFLLETKTKTDKLTPVEWLNIINDDRRCSNVSVAMKEGKRSTK